MSEWGKSIMFFAQDAQTKTLRHVREVPTGLKCGCICCGCGEPVEAVNAQAKIFKNRPHFRHISQSSRDDCQSNSIDLALSEALTKAAVDLRSVLLPGPRMLDSQFSPASASNITSFHLVDTCEGILCLPDGRKLRVHISAHVKGGPAHEQQFDITLSIPSEIIEEGWNVNELRRYLTTDPNCWRWCKQQTSPSLFSQPVVAASTYQEKPFPIKPSVPVHEMHSIERINSNYSHPIELPAINSPRTADERRIPVKSVVMQKPDGTTLVIRRWKYADGSMGEDPIEVIPPKPRE